MTLTSYRITRDGADRLLFLMHGYSAEQHHLASYVPLVDPDERFTAIAPRGPVPLPDGDTDGASWWSIDFETFEFRTDEFEASLATLERFIADEAAAAGVPLERCVIGGFSQGGYLALSLVGKPMGVGHHVDRVVRQRLVPHPTVVVHQAVVALQALLLVTRIAG